MDRRETGSNINDGFYQIAYENDGVFLSVYPPVGNGRRVDLQTVLDRLSRKKIRNFNRDIVQLTVTKADKTPVKIAGPQEEIRVDVTANVTTSPDKMKGYISFNPPENGRMMTMEEVLDQLGKNGIIYGINRTNLETIIKYPVYNEIICIAEGTPPANGQNGKVEFRFDIKRESKPTILDDGRVDFRELNLIQSAEQGQVLCSLTPPIRGTPGKTVCGIDIPALDGKPAALPKGRNVSVTEDGQNLLAGISGQINYIDGKVNVFSTYEVPADVDNSTGNINFIGNVIVRGNVLSGFVVEAGGTVEVMGVAEGAIIKAGSDIILRRGIQGMGKGVLISGGDIIARYIENSNVEARNDIKAEAIMHSYVKCGNKLELSGKKGLLVGGNCKVGKEISAKVIGSHMGTVTDIEVGVDPTIRERYKAVKEELIKSETDLRKAEQAITILKKLEMAGALTPEKQEMLAKSVRTRIFLTNRFSELKEEMAALESNLQQDAYGKVKCYNFIYPGTKVAIGSCMMYVKENLQYCSLYRDGADIRVGGIDK
ncbi:MAG TPA: FapA family protein [Clostridia bacterium]|nr:FapA family protein [Clostridia bacterium]